MGFYNMPAGCLGPSDLDHAAALGMEPQQCQGCKQAVHECECCKECGAAPDQACEPDCGLSDDEPPHASGCVCADCSDADLTARND